MTCLWQMKIEKPVCGSGFFSLLKETYYTDDILESSTSSYDLGSAFIRTGGLKLPCIAKKKKKKVLESILTNGIYHSSGHLATTEVI